MKKYYDTLTDSAGNAQPSALVYVFDYGTTNLSSLFSTSNGTALANPVTTNNRGLFKFYAANGRYTVVSGDAVVDDILLFDPSEPTALVDINGGTIDGAVIGESDPRAVNATTLKSQNVLVSPNAGEDTIMAVGDSITSNGNATPTSITDWVWAGQSYLGWACMLSLGKLKYGGAYGTGGYTTAQIIATHIPTIVSARPKFCVVHAGTNDLGTLTLAQTKANLVTMYNTLIAAGITPIATTLLPKQTLIGTSAYFIQRLNIWILDQSRVLNIPCVDWNILLSATDGNWTGYGAPGTYNVDTTHPNTAGAMLMGQAISDAITSYGFIARTNYLPRVSDNSGISTYSPTDDNALVLNDTNADGVADGLNKSGTGNCTLSAMGGAGVGNWQNLAATSAAAVNIFGNNRAIVNGNKMLFTCRYKTTGVVAAAGTFECRFVDANNFDIFAFKNITADVSNGVIYYEFSIPSGMVTLLARPWFSVQGTGATLSVGQIGVIDLTAAGLV